MENEQRAVRIRIAFKITDSRNDSCFDFTFDNSSMIIQTNPEHRFKPIYSGVYITGQQIHMT